MYYIVINLPTLNMLFLRKKKYLRRLRRTQVPGVEYAKTHITPCLYTTRKSGQKKKVFPSFFGRPQLRITTLSLQIEIAAKRVGQKKNRSKLRVIELLVFTSWRAISVFFSARDTPYIVSSVSLFNSF